MNTLYIRSYHKTGSLRSNFASADVQFSAQNQVPVGLKTKKKRSSRLQAVACPETSQHFSWRNDLTCFHCS